MNGDVLGMKSGLALRNEKIQSSYAPGSVPHIIANDKIENKGKVIKEILKEEIKDTVTLGGVVAGTGVGAATAVGVSHKLTNGFVEFKKVVGKNLNKVLIKNNKKMTSVKNLIKNTNVFKKLSKLTIPAQAGIVAAGAALAIFTPIIAKLNIAHSAHIEGQNETK